MNKVSWGPVSTFPQSTSDLTIQRRDGNENVKIQYKYFTGASHFFAVFAWLPRVLKRFDDQKQK